MIGAGALGVGVFPGDQKNQATSARISGKKVDDIIALWMGDVSDHQRAFTEQAREVMKIDQELIENGNKIQELEKDINRVDRAQRDLVSRLASIEANQESLNKHLNDLVRGLKSDNSNVHGEREDTFLLASQIDKVGWRED
uniref:Nucleoporin NSP1-like C-terminal domain-containing protein n=1 Tax=Lotharella globosa TaxID=91324 RepID=A0A7S3YQP3_9EUKA